ncbi:MAG: CDP-alcohol phosphatidyltransferase family protein [Ruminococcaceae bacterium]|nr:CDP-alcohol phosphatidyltransferase family protein [Oscillospiraceae bacterium]
MFIKDWKKDLFTIPNMLSLFRLLLIPVYIVIYLNADADIDYYIAGGILAVSCLTDMIDGQIARHFNMISTIGKILDPFADKITQFSLIVCLTLEYPILLPLVILFFIKEVFQLVAGLLTLRKGQMLTGALITGKISTAVLFVSLIILVMFPNIGPVAVNIIMVVDGILLLISFLHYAITYFTHGKMIQELNPTEKEENT